MTVGVLLQDLDLVGKLRLRALRQSDGRDISVPLIARPLVEVWLARRSGSVVESVALVTLSMLTPRSTSALAAVPGVARVDFEVIVLFGLVCVHYFTEAIESFGPARPASRSPPT